MIMLILYLIPCNTTKELYDVKHQSHKHKIISKKFNKICWKPSLDCRNILPMDAGGHNKRVGNYYFHILGASWCAHSKLLNLTFFDTVIWLGLHHRNKIHILWWDLNIMLHSPQFTTLIIPISEGISVTYYLKPHNAITSYSWPQYLLMKVG